MAATLAKLGFGSALKRGDGGSPETFTVVDEVKVIPAIRTKRELVKVTHHQSPSGFQEYILGLKDGEEMQFEGNYIDSAQQQGVQSDHENEIKRNWQVTVPAATGTKTFSFPGLITACEVDPPMEEAQMIRFTIKPDAITRS